MSDSIHCRACFETIDIQVEKICKLKNKVRNYDVSLGQILSDCTGLYLENDLVEKEIICVLCKQNLISYYKFREKVFDTDKKFKELKVQNVGETLPIIVKLEEVKIEVDVWEPEFRNDEEDCELEEKYNKSEIDAESNEKLVKVSKGRPRARKTEKVKKVRLHKENRRRRYRDPQRKENLMKYNRNVEGLYECPKDNCPGLFKNMGHLEMHLENKHPDTDQKTFPCENCGEEFPTLLLHKRHVFKFHTPRPYICDLCGNDYPFFDSLRSHMYVHLHSKNKREKAKCACTICGKLYVCVSNMMRHRKEVHFPKALVPKPYVCSVCGSVWATKSKLGAHMRNHETPEFFCDICSKGFSVKGSLTMHMQVHTSNRPFFCDICGKTYKTKYQLRNHQISHSDERTLKCSMCPAMFKMPNSLRVHESQVHASTGPVSCDVCGKLCKNKSSLKSHLVLHSGKDLQCSHCDKKYKVLDTLKRHVQRVHMGLKKRHECSICLKNLWSRKHIADHIEDIHKNVLTETDKTADELVRKYWTSDPSGANLGEVPPKGLIGRPMCV